MDIENLTFEGAGIFGITYIGALSILESRKILKNIKRYSGSSSGAIIATLLSIGYSLTELEKLLTETKWSTFLDTSCCCGIFNFFNIYGFNKGKSKEKWFKKIIKNKSGYDNLTFKQIYDLYNKELYICAINLNHEKPIYFSYKYSPNMPVWLALQMSTCFPYIFSPIKYKNEYYIDGGVMENYPIEIFDDKHKSLGFKIISSDSYNKNLSNIYEYSTCVLSSSLRALDDKDTGPYIDRTIFINIPKQGLLTSVLDIEEIIINYEDYYNYGRKYTIKYLDKIKNE